MILFENNLARTFHILVLRCDDDLQTAKKQKALSGLTGYFNFKLSIIVKKQTSQG